MKSARCRWESDCLQLPSDGIGPMSMGERLRAAAQRWNRPDVDGRATARSCPAMLIPPSPPPLALPSWDRKALLGSERSGAKFIGILLLVSNNNLATEIHLLQELVEHFGQGLGAQVIFTEEILKNIIN